MRPRKRASRRSSNRRRSKPPPLGITVNAIAPGPIDTPFLDLVDDPGRYERTAQMIPMGRIGAPADVVGAALFFLDAGSDYITGQVLHVNGGFLMP